MKQIFITIILISPILFFHSCKREINNQSMFKEKNTYSDSEIVAIFSPLGKLHNDGLDSIYKQLERNNSILIKMPNTIEKRSIVYGIINQSIHKFIDENLRLKNINIDEALQNVFNEPNNSFGKDLVTQITKSRKVINYSSTYLTLINKIDILINENAQEQAYKNLIIENISSLSEDFEKMHFVSSVSIAYNSTTYWKNNLEKWRYLLNPIYAKKQIMNVDVNKDPNKTGTDIGKADVSGIIYGAAIGCGIGAIGGSVVLPGVGTVTGCAGMGAAGAITGGLGGSAKTAVDKLIDWILS